MTDLPTPPVAGSELFVQARVLERPGLVHGFSTRRGGVSDGVFASLNLGDGLGDLPENVAENRRRLVRALSSIGPATGTPGAAGGLEEFLLPEWPLATVRQVHGADVVVIDRPPDPENPDRHWAGGDGDALVTDIPGWLLGVRTADCVPILVAGQRAVAAVHAGWRGTTLRILRQVLEVLEARFGERPEGLRVAIGPAVCLAHYAVGGEVVAALERALASAPGGTDGVVVPIRPGDPDGDRAVARVDLKEANARLAREAGVPDEQIEVMSDCVVLDSTRFFSHRRDGGRTGRMLSVVGRRIPPPGGGRLWT